MSKKDDIFGDVFGGTEPPKPPTEQVKDLTKKVIDYTSRKDKFWNGNPRFKLPAQRKKVR